MKNETKDLMNTNLAAGSLARLFNGFGPQIFLAPDDGTGNGGADDGSKNEAASEDDTSKEKSTDDGTNDDGDKDQGDDDKGQETGSEEAKKKFSDDDAAALLQENMKKKGQITDLKAELKKFEGVDPAEYKALKAAQAEAAQAELEAKGEFDRVKDMMKSQHETEVSSLNDQISDLKAQLAEASGTINNLTIGTRFNDSGFIKDELVFTPQKARRLWGEHFAQENGEVVAYDKPASAADRTLLVDAKGDPLSFEDAIRHLVNNDPERDQIIRNKVKTGANSGDKTPEKAASKPDTGSLRGVDRIRVNIGNMSFGSKK